MIYDTGNDLNVPHIYFNGPQSDSNCTGSDFCKTGSDVVKPEVKFLKPEMTSVGRSMCF